MSDHPEWTRTVQDIHEATGIPEDGSGQKIRNRLRRNEFGADWEKRRNGQYYMSEDTFREACRRLQRNG